MRAILRKLFNHNKKVLTEVKITLQEDTQQIIKINNDKIDVLCDVELNEFLNKSKDLDSYKLPMKTFIKEGNLIKKQSIYQIENEGIKYTFSISDRIIRISRVKVDDKINELVIDIDKFNSDYKITKYVHDLNHSTISTRWYPLNDESMSMFYLDRVEALKDAQLMLNELEDIGINKIVYIDRLFNHLNLVPEYKYYPVIKDDKITLSWPCRFNETDVNKRDYEFFDIILNDTREMIGNISFDYRLRAGFSYGGNVAYNIKKKYRGNHYASKALNLLKQLLKDNEFEGDKDLYVATVIDNSASQHVAMNNEGELVYKGKVPENDSVNYIDGVKKVTVYKIKL